MCLVTPGAASSASASLEGTASGSHLDVTAAQPPEARIPIDQGFSASVSLILGQNHPALGAVLSSAGWLTAFLASPQ